MPFPRYSVTAILDGSRVAELVRGPDCADRHIGAGMQDLRATPLRPETPGVDIHATAIDNLLAGDMLWTPSWIPPRN
jgi:adenylate cyclase